MPRTQKRTAPVVSSEVESQKQKLKSRQTSKSETLIGLLKRTQGLSISEMMEAARWRSHSIREFMAGTLKKKHGHTAILTTNKSRERRYHVA
jgi:hypothetical protein